MAFFFLLTMIGVVEVHAEVAVDTNVGSEGRHALPHFESQVIDAKVAIGYGTVLEDVDGDGKTDILLADKQQFVWYRNPTWQRFVMAENLTERDNVCIAARDIDGDGRVEVAVGGQWNPGDTVGSGAVFYLQAPEDRTKPWKPIKLHHEPVVHRMRWVRIAEEKYALIVAPLHGRANRGGAGEGARLLAYLQPANPGDMWTTELIDDSMHVTHNFDRGQWIGDETSAEEVAYLGREGGSIFALQNNKWKKIASAVTEGGGEIRLGAYSNGQKLIATIEPFHGDKLVLYDYETTANRPTQKRRFVLDDQLNQGHAVAVADLTGDGEPEIVAGWRKANAAGKFGIKLHYRTPTTAKDSAGDSTNGWQSVWVDENEMACEDLRIADLDADGRPDIVAAGRSTHNLKIYWNRK